MGDRITWVLGSLVLYAISLWAKIGLLGWFIMISLADFFWRYKLDGSITPTELKQLHGRKRVTLTDITRITGRCWRNVVLPDNVILDVYTEKSCLVLAVDECEVLNLIRTGFGNWAIRTQFLSNKNRFVIRPCAPDIPKRIEYDAVGRYAFSPDAILFSILFFVLGSSIVYSFGLINVWVLLYLLFTPYLLLLPTFFAKVKVSLDEKGIMIKDADGIRFLPFDEITSVEKGLHRINITTKSGEKLYFPRACYMLAELIKEFIKEEQQPLTIHTPDAE
ncbi:membrane hypothetical protein [uncultured Sporomusa sp.]|uniref:Uncharacterized protein n=1 Tax=uncultured Sporomusa sp. TaxID=307249 RepID=A0A212M016_9FIRM|nr:hypothetical protein [uncultured Sporomusa sp.]SCM83184.1 membrane hypothetical protein [uncultured Sporomusa sp.]